MTNSQPRASRPSAIRRRPQQPPVQSVDEFIQAGTNQDPPIEGTAATAPVSTAEPSPPPPAAVSPVPTAPPVSSSPVSASPVIMQDIPIASPPARASGEGKTYLALLIGACALGVGLFNAYHGMKGASHEVLKPAPPPENITPVYPVSPSSEITQPEGGISAATPSVSTGTQGVEWLALTNLQFARHDFLLGLNDSAMASLVLAKVHLSLLGHSFADETTALDRIISTLQNTSVLSLEQLDRDIESLKETWLRLTFGPRSQRNESLIQWLNSWNQWPRQEGRSELENTDEGRYLVARLDRLKWLALWGDEKGIRQVSASLENFLGAQFLNSPEAKPWLAWIRGLQRIPLRHDVTELNALIVRLSRLELPP